MSNGLATGIALFLTMFPVALIAFAGRTSGLLAPVAVAVTVGAVSIGFIQTGLLGFGSLAPTNVARLLPTQPFANRCEETFDVLREAGVVLAAPTAEGLVVRSESWDQLPQQVQEAVLACTIMMAAPTAEQIPLIRR